MNRRVFIAGLGTAAVWPVAWAQQPGRTYRLAFISGLSHDNPLIAAFFDELRLSGMIEGQNLQLIPGGFYRRYEELRETIPANVRSAPDAIFCGGDIAARALLEATKTLPLVAISDDMVEAGLVKSLARPGGNMTGVSLLATDRQASGYSDGSRACRTTDCGATRRQCPVAAIAEVADQGARVGAIFRSLRLLRPMK